MSLIEEINAELAVMIPYQARHRKIQPVSAFTKSEDWYSYLINDWIVNESDSEVLMNLLIKIHFDPKLFVGFVVHGFDFWERNFR
jgi:hypothetical protein